jgi:hypothetical protein
VWKKKKNSDATTALPHTSTDSWCVEEKKTPRSNEAITIAPSPNKKL